MSNSKQIKSIFSIAIFQYLSTIDDEEIVPIELSDRIIKYVNPNNIPEHILLKSKRLQDTIDWHKLKKYKLIKLWSKNLQLIEKIDLDLIDFTVSELFPLFLINNKLIDYFEIDLNNISGTDAIKILECDTERINQINLKRYKFTNKEILDIIKKFGRIDEIMNQVDLSGLDHFNLRSLIKKTGSKYINQVDLSKLKATDWLEILRVAPDLLEQCNLLLFEKNDCFNLVKLAELFPTNSMIFELIEANKKEIPAIGWEKLLIINPKLYLDICNYDLLNKKHWDNIVAMRPELNDIMKRYV